MTEKQLRRFLQVMVDNLVDSNVFMRSLVLSVEHSSFRQDFRTGEGGEDDGHERGDGDKDGDEEEEETAPRLGGPAAAGAGGEAALSAAAAVSTAAGGDGCGRQNSRKACTDAKGQGEDEEGVVSGGGGGGYGHGGDGGWLGYDGGEEPCYLGHTWYDVQPQEVPEEEVGGGGGVEGGRKQGCAEISENRGVGEAEGKGASQLREGGDTSARGRGARRKAGTSGGGVERGELTRLQCFLKHNTPQLVRDLMCVVNLETINHENICCLNTAVLILIFADRRGQLAEVRGAEKREALIKCMQR